MGAEILGLLLGGMSNLITNQTNEDINQMQMLNQRELLGMQQNFAANQARLADLRTRALYNDLQSPEAIRKQLEKAGLSVGMMYGQGGMGGTMSSGAQAASPSAAGASIFGHTPLGMEAAAILQNMKKNEAETENIKSQTELNKAELPKKQKEIEQIEQNIKNSEQAIKESEQKIENMIAEKENTLEATKDHEAQRELWKASAEYQREQAKLTMLQADWLPQMNEKQIEMWNATIKQMEAAAAKLGVEKEILEGQKQSLIDKLYWEALQAKQIWQELTPAQIQKLRAESQNINWKNITEKNINDMVNRLGLEKGAGEIIKTVILVLSQIAS